MNAETTLAVLIALVPVAVLWVGLECANRAALRREEAIGRQIALTDALHRELGAVVAPNVSGSERRGWTVSVRMPLSGEVPVEALARITHELFQRLDRRESPRVRLVLMERPAARPWPGTVPVTPRVPVRLGRAA